MSRVVASARGSVGTVLAAATLAVVASWSVPAGAASQRSAAPVAAPSRGACADPSGVTVVVDFGAFGAGVEVRCAGWPVDDGYDALRRAGFTITDTTRFPGLLCKLDDLPSDQACVNAPPPDAHWGYSYADRGGSWTYSSQGARARDVQPGDVEGWAFGKAARPSIAPPAPPPTTTAVPPPPPDPPATAAPGPAAPPPEPVAAPPKVPSTVEPGEPVDGEVEPSGSSATTSEDGGGGVVGDGEDGGRAGGEDDLTAGPRDTRLATSQRAADPGSGSPLPAVATATVVAALVGGGVVIRRRRGAGA